MDLIKEALELLDHDEDEDWNEDGAPRMEAVSALVGRDVSRQEITDSAPGFSRGVDAAPEEPKVEESKQIAKLDLQISALQSDQGVIEDNIRELKRERAVLSSAIRPEYNHNLDQARRMEHIRRQREHREGRAAARHAALRGIDPKHLQPASPIDHAMATRKSRHAKRPERLGPVGE